MDLFTLCADDNAPCQNYFVVSLFLLDIVATDERESCLDRIYVDYECPSHGGVLLYFNKLWSEAFDFEERRPSK